MSEADTAPGVLPLGYSYSIGQGWLHDPVPAMEYFLPNTRAGMPPAYYEAEIRSLHPEAQKWGGLQINAIFTYLSNNHFDGDAFLPVDTEETDPNKFSMDWDADRGITKERRVYWLSADGPADNPANWKLACNFSGYSTEQQRWIPAHTKGADAVVWFQSGGGLTFETSIGIGDWFDAQWRSIVAYTAVVASIAGTIVAIAATVASFGVASPAIAGALAGVSAALGLVAGLAAKIPDLVKAVQTGNFTDMMTTLAEMGKSLAAFGAKYMSDLKEKDPKTYALLSDTADKVKGIYNKIEATEKQVEKSVVNVINAAKQYGTDIAHVTEESFVNARNILPPQAQVFFDEAYTKAVNELPDYAATKVPWYMQDVVKLVGLLKGSQEAQADAIRKKSMMLANPALMSLSPADRIRQMTMMPIFSAPLAKAQLTVNPLPKTKDATASGSPFVIGVTPTSDTSPLKALLVVGALGGIGAFLYKKYGK